MNDYSKLAIAVLIPCYNEEQTVGEVVREFRRHLQTATIFVYDNNSTDTTRDVAKAAGAVVKREALQGKGNVVQRMFADIDADIYVLVDGDNTYDAASAPFLVSLLLENNLDMVNARRESEAAGAYRTGHRLGNRVLTRLVGLLFGKQFDDILSGYRVFSHRFVKSFPAMSRGFETETEFTIHALELRMAVQECTTPYFERPLGSASKLKTYRDGFRILRTIAILVKEERPLQFFAGIFAVLASISVALAVPIVDTFIETGLVPRFPTAILATGLMLLAFLSLSCGLVLDTVTRGRREIKRLAYLSHSWLRTGAYRQ